MGQWPIPEAAIAPQLRRQKLVLPLKPDSSASLAGEVQ